MDVPVSSSSRSTHAMGLLDLHGIHRDIVAYYRQFGFLNSSTSTELAEIILRNCTIPPAPANTSVSTTESGI